MTKTVLSVGQCSMDHGAIERFLTTHFDVQVLQADDAQQTLDTLKQTACDLVLVNRKLDCDYSDGVEVIQRIKAEPAVESVPVMLVTNYAEHQQLAIDAGAELGFGKLEFEQPETIARLRGFLTEGKPGLGANVGA